MVSLLDIVPTKRVVETSFGSLDVPGISLANLAYILKQHPTLLTIIQKGEVSLDVESILDLGLDVSASFFAAGLGYSGNKEAEEICKTFKLEDALDIGEAIIDESFPKGAQSFLDRVKRLALGIKAQSPIEVSQQEVSLSS